MAQNILGILPVTSYFSCQGAVTTVGESPQGLEIRYKFPPKGIKMNVSDKFSEIEVFLADDRFITVLKKLAVAFVPAVEGNGIPRQQFPHERREAISIGSQEKVGVIGHQDPGVTEHVSLGNKRGESVDEVFVVFFVSEDFSSFDSPDDDMMENSRGIEAGLPWHVLLLPYPILSVN